MNALQRSSLTLQLADFVEEVTHCDQADILLRLADVREAKSDGPVTTAGNAALEALHRLLLDSSPSVPVCSEISVFVQHQLELRDASQTWAAVVRAPSSWELHSRRVLT